MPDYKVTVSYGGFQLIPGPLLGLKLSYQRSNDGSKRSAVWSIQVRGKLVAFKGSPDPSIDNGDDDRFLAQFWKDTGYPTDPSANDTGEETRVARLREKMAAIRWLFAQDGLWYEVFPGDGTAPIRFQPRIGEIDFSEGQWFNDVTYTIPMETDTVFFGDLEQTAADIAQDDNAPEQSWSLEPADSEGRTYKLTHNVSATARKRYDDDGSVLLEGWEVARALVLGEDPVTDGENTLGYQATFLEAAGVLDLTAHEPYNYVRTQQADPAGGRFSVTESWLCADPSETVSGETDGKAVEEITVETRGSVEGYTTVVVNGTITGLEERHPTTYALTTSRWDNADARATAVLATASVAHTLAETYSAVTLNPEPVSTTVSRNRVTGVVQFTTQFDTRPANTDGNYLTESYTVTFENPGCVIAELGVVQRPTGPILQDTGSMTRRTVTVEASITVRAAYGSPLPAAPTPDMQTLALSAIGSVPTQFYLVSDRPMWNDRQGRYSRTSTFIYEP